MGGVKKDLDRAGQNAPKAVKEVTKTLPNGQVKVPKEVKTPGGGSVKTGEPGKTGPSVTPPHTQLPVPPLPPVQLPALPQNGLTSGLGLACVLVSGAAGVATLALEWRGRFAAARYTVALAVAAIVAGMAAAQEPYLLPTSLTVEEAAAPDATLTALLGGAAIGLCILIPALTWLFRLTLRGDLDKGSNV